MTEKNRRPKNFKIELATNKNNIERYEPAKWKTERHRRRGTLRCLGLDDQHFHYGRTVHLCLGKFGHFVSSREANGSLTSRTASLELAGICHSQITLELAIRLLDKIDAYRLKKITRSRHRRRDIA